MATAETLTAAGHVEVAEAVVDTPNLDQLRAARVLP